MMRLQRLLLIAGVAFTAYASAQDSVKLPDIGDSSGAVVSQQDEREYGEALMREFRRLAHVVDDPLIEDYIRHLGYSLVAQSDDPSRNFTFFVVDDDSVNAFAAPGGFIGVHSELILTADNESEVAAVLAHEVAHVTQRHIARAIESAQKVSLPLMLLMLGAAVAGSGDADAVNTALVGGQALMRQLQINFTRANEYEADRIGIHTLARAGYDPEGMSSFFGKMLRLSRNYGQGPPEFLRTHPVGTTRIAEAKNRAKQVQVIDAPQRDPLNFRLMQERLRVLSSEKPYELIGYYKSLEEAGESGPAQEYGLGLAHLANNDLVGAAEAIDGLSRQLPNALPVQVTMARIEFLTRNDETRSERFETLIAHYPGNRAISSIFADSLLMSGRKKDANKAERLLRPLLAEHRTDSALHLLYSRAADQAGRPVRAKEAFAEHVFLQGRVFDALAQLRELLESPHLDYYERSRVESRVAELEPIMARIQRENGYDPSEGRRRRKEVRQSIVTFR